MEKLSIRRFRNEDAAKVIELHGKGIGRKIIETLEKDEYF